MCLVRFASFNRNRRFRRLARRVHSCTLSALHANAAKFMRWFNEITLVDVPLVGGKNASLGEMYWNLSSAGVRVPGGFSTNDIIHSQEQTMTRATARATRRSDTDIFVEARNALDRHPTVPATVRVHVDKGVATLTGTVRVVFESAEAEDIVRHVRGVDRVVNEVNIAHVPSKEGFEPPNNHT